ncbi:G-protein coupled receptor 55 [Mugil cephalus]|uniref:G-protein coupled receptor 55 n=1 Tax=Mugil cephalus TaxID=48193 RepID=UPI001FB5FCE3|nr:G-protein coupled receptor 55 [Mugil cephalus]
MSMCNNTFNDTCKVDTLQGVGYAAVFLVGFLVNAAALRAFIAKRKSWTDMHIYMFNLAIADFALVLFLPFRIYDAFFCLPKTCFCTFLISIHFINMYASIYTTAAISFQRYLVVRFPLQARLCRRKKETAFVVCLVIWVMLVVVCYIYRKENYPDKLWTCYERCKDQPLKGNFIVILEICGLVLPLLIVVFCSSRIIFILKVDKKSMEKRSTVAIVTANMIVFIACYLPIHIGFIVNYYNTVPKDWMCQVLPAHVYLQVAEWIASTNCCFDSISYYFLLKRFYSQVGTKTNSHSFRTMSTMSSK